MQERNYLVGLLSENHEISEHLGSAFGKPGEKTDLQFFDKLDSDLNAVFCVIDALGYPDKLKSIIQTMMMCEFHILLVDLEKGITPAIGELILLLDVFAKNYDVYPLIAIGNVTSQTDYLLEDTVKKIKAFISTTSLKDIQIEIIREKEDREKIKKIIYDLGAKLPLPIKDDDKTICFIDHVFPVKGIGTVVLGTVKQGTVIASKMLNLVLLKKKVIIRSIQKQDRDFKTAEAGDRVGLALKGIKPEEISRNEIFASPDLFEVSNKLKIKAEMLKFFKGSLGPDIKRQYTAFINLASTPFTVISGSTINPGETGEMEIEFSKPMPLPLEDCKGVIVELSKFENKLRVVGFFKAVKK